MFNTICFMCLHNPQLNKWWNTKVSTVQVNKSSTRKWKSQNQVLSKSLFCLCIHGVKNSSLLFKVAISGSNMIVYFSDKQSLQELVVGLKVVCCCRIFHLTSNSRPVLCGSDRTTMEETVRQPQVQHEAQWPEDLLLLGRLRVEVEGRGEGFRHQVENPAAAHHFQPHQQLLSALLAWGVHNHVPTGDGHFSMELEMTCTVDTFVNHHLFNWGLWQHMKQIVLNISIKLVWL